MKRLLGCVAACATLFAGSSAFAFTECTYTVDKVYYGTPGQVYVIFNGSSGGAGIYIDPGMASKDKFFSLLLTAKAANRPVMVRYVATGASCAGEHTDLDGMWLT